MNEGKTVFSQLIGYLPDRDFRRFVALYGGDRYAKKLSCWQQFLAMALHRSLFGCDWTEVVSHGLRLCGRAFYSSRCQRES